MEPGLREAVALFNDGRFSEFQDALEGLTSSTRAPSERQFYTLLNKLAEALLQLSDGDVEDAAEMLGASLRKLDDFLPRFRGLNTEALRDELEDRAVAHAEHRHREHEECDREGDRRECRHAGETNGYAGEEHEKHAVTTPAVGEEATYGPEKAAEQDDERG